MIIGIVASSGSEYTPGPPPDPEDVFPLIDFHITGINYTYDLASLTVVDHEFIGIDYE